MYLWSTGSSIDDTEDARRKYLHNKILTAIIPHFVDKKYDDDPFELICDDFRFAEI